MQKSLQEISILQRNKPSIQFHNVLFFKYDTTTYDTFYYFLCTNNEKLTFEIDVAR